MRVVYDYTKKRHILAVCGIPLVLAEIKADLSGHFDVGIASSVGLAVAFLEKYGADAIILYLEEMRESHGRDFARFLPLIDHAKGCNIPLIFLGEKDDVEDEANSFDCGAADYAVRRRGDAKALTNRINLRIQEQSGGECDPGGTASILSGKTILVAEDVELNREIIYALLSDIEGLVLDFAENGKEAVEKFTSDPCRYSLVLMDVNMPVMDGLDASKIIRSLKCENSKDIPIIAMTAYINQEEITSCLKSGMDDFVKKPMSYGDLFDIIAKHC